MCLASRPVVSFRLTLTVDSLASPVDRPVCHGCVVILMLIIAYSKEYARSLDNFRVLFLFVSVLGVAQETCASDTLRVFVGIVCAQESKRASCCHGFIVCSSVRPVLVAAPSLDSSRSLDRSLDRSPRGEVSHYWVCSAWCSRAWSSRVVRWCASRGKDLLLYNKAIGNCVMRRASRGVDLLMYNTSTVEGRHCANAMVVAFNVTKSKPRRGTMALEQLLPLTLRASRRVSMLIVSVHV